MEVLKHKISFKMNTEKVIELSKCYNNFFQGLVKIGLKENKIFFRKIDIEHIFNFQKRIILKPCHKAISNDLIDPESGKRITGKDQYTSLLGLRQILYKFLENNFEDIEEKILEIYFRNLLNVENIDIKLESLYLINTEKLKLKKTIKKCSKRSPPVSEKSDSSASEEFSIISNNIPEKLYKIENIDNDFEKMIISDTEDKEECKDMDDIKMDEISEMDVEDSTDTLDISNATDSIEDGISFLEKDIKIKDKYLKDEKNNKYFFIISEDSKKMVFKKRSLESIKYKKDKILFTSRKDIYNIILSISDTYKNIKNKDLVIDPYENEDDQKEVCLILQENFTFEKDILPLLIKIGLKNELN
jgi:hypothetical protein